MKIDDALIESVLRLARLDLPRGEFEKYKAHLQQILDYVEVLGELDLEGVAPMSCAASSPAVLRADAEAESAAREDVLANAPARAGAFFKVPRILDQTEGS